MPTKKIAPKKEATTKNVVEKSVKKVEVHKTAAPVATSQKAFMDKIAAGFSQVQSNKQGGGGKFSFYKMKAAKNKFRVIVPPEGPFCIGLKQHRGKRFGKFASKIDLGWLVSPKNAQFAQAMKERFGLSKEDEKLIRTYGDPFDLLFKSLQANGKETLYTKRGIGQKRVLFVVYADDAFHILETSQTIAEALSELAEENPDYLDMGKKGQYVQITGKGEKLRRRYGAPMLVGTPEAIEVDDASVIPNLLDVLSMRSCSYLDKVKFLFHSYPDLVNEAGLSASDFGVEEFEDEEDNSSTDEESED